MIRRYLLPMHWRQTIRLAFPLMLSFLGAQAMEMIDMMMIGHLGVTTLAAAAFVHSLVNIFVTLGLGFASAVSILVARVSAGDDAPACGHIVRLGFWLNTSVGLVMLAILAGLGQYLGAFGQTPEVVAAARGYYVVMAASVLPAIIFQTWKQFTDGLGKTRQGSVAILASLILNVFFNWLLINGNWGLPRLGMIGAAWGTLLSRCSLAVFYYLYIRHASVYRAYGIRMLGRVTSGLRRELLRPLAILGAAASLQYLFEVGVFSASTLMVGWIDEVSLASHQIAMKVSAACFMVPLALSFAASIRVGEAVGQCKPGLAWELGWSTVALSACLMLSMGVVLFVARHWIVSWFIGDPEVVKLAASLLVIAAVFQLFDSTQAVAVGALRGMIDTKVPAILTFVAYWLLCFPAAYFFAFHAGYGVAGIWYGLMLGLSCSSLFLNTRFYLLSRRLRRAAEHQGAGQAPEQAYGMS